jgi:threonylcarbamoyladenosine tRNA methylthiotransferase MtaB
MIELGKRLSHDFHQQFVGQTLNVLWESNVGADSGGLRWAGYTENYIRVQANGPADMFNHITPTEMVEATPDRVLGVVKSDK